MGFTNATTMKFQLLLISAAMAAEFKCYTSDPTNQNDVVTCNNNTITGHCYTLQTTDVDGKSEYERGCMPIDNTYNAGCIVATVDDKQGSICYQSCTRELCNTHTNLNSSATLATGSILSALFYMMM